MELMERVLLCHFHGHAFRFHCSHVIGAELGCVSESLWGSRQEAAPVYVEQAQLMHYLQSFYILKLMGNITSHFTFHNTYIIRVCVLVLYDFYIITLL